MNAFSPLKIHLSSSPALLFLYLLTYCLGSFSLFQLSLSFEQFMLTGLAYTGLLLLLAWRDLRVPASERVDVLYWDVEHGHMSVKTGEGAWTDVVKLHQSWSLPGVVQIMQLQRADRYFPTRLVITPDCVSCDDSRRLHVAITWGPPLESRPAKESLSE